MSKPIKDRVMDVLLRHDGQWVLAFHIAREARCHSGASEPAVRQAIAALIKEGVPVISCSGGYKIAQSPAEVAMAASALRVRADEINRRVEALHAAWRIWEESSNL